VDANPVSFLKNVLVIGFDPEFQDHLGLVDNSRNHTLLQTKLAELGHANCQIKFIKAEVPIGQSKPATSAPMTPVAKSPKVPAAVKTVVGAPATEKKSAPLIQKALEIFKGQIVEVRA
jgi:hypothetical protein